MTVTEFRQYSERSNDRARLQEAFDDVIAFWYSMAPSSSAARLEDDLEASEDVDLLDFMRGLSQCRRQLDAVLALTANEIETRSTGLPGRESLALRHGYRNARDFVAEVMRVEPREAATIARVGEAVVGERGLTGSRVPPKSEHVAAALREGDIGILHSNEIVKFAKRLEMRVAPELLAEGERELVAVAREGMRIRDFREVCARLEAHLDPDGVEPTIAEQRRHRSLTMRTDVDTGMLHMRAKLDAESAAFVAHALQSYTTGCMRAARGANQVSDSEVPSVGEAPLTGEANCEASSELLSGAASADAPGVRFVPTDSLTRGPGGDLTMDTRSIPQIQADGLVDFCKHILGCDLSKLPGASTSLVVRMSVDDLVPAGDCEDESEDTVERRSGTPNDQQNVNRPDYAGEFEQADAKDSGSSRSGASKKSGAVKESGAAKQSGASKESGAAKQSGTSQQSRARGASARGAGLATVDGGPVLDIATARKLAAAANLIPMVLGTDGAVLDLGRTARHFTQWQRLALVERDGGCAFCGLPPGMAEAHHMWWWRAHNGKTDLDNGVLLCTSCHHRVHEGWEIRIEHAPGAPPHQRKRGGTVWFIPPADIDWRREPRLGGRKRFDVAYRKANPPTPIRGYSGASWIEGWRWLGTDATAS